MHLLLRSVFAAGFLFLGITPTANALDLTSQVSDLYNLFPVSNQGENGINLLTLEPSSGIYTALQYYGPSQWYFNGTTSPAIYATQVSSGVGFLPIGSTNPVERDAVMSVNVSGAFETMHIAGSISSYGGGSASIVNFSIYQGANSYNAPLWSYSIGRGMSANYSFDVNLNSGSDYFFRVNSDFADLGYISWQIGLSGTNPIPSVPEPETNAMMLAGLGLLGIRLQSRKSTQL